MVHLGPPRLALTVDVPDRTPRGVLGVGRAMIGRVAASVLRGYARAGGSPATAHAYYH